MKRRITQRQIADCAGVNVSTVSLALRDSPRLTADTREKIQALAKKMGYVPDPALSALCSYRNSISPHKVQSGLVFLTDDDNPFSVMVYENAKSMAQSLGYNLIKYFYDETEISLRRLQSIWWNTSLKGVLIGPFHTIRPLTEDWSRWPVVAYGYSIPEPAFNRVAVDHFEDMLIHLRVLRERGYKRIGLCLPHDLNSRSRGRLRAAYLLDQDLSLKQDVIPIFSDQNMESPEALDQWIRTHRLDAVMADEIGYYHTLLKLGWKIPEEIGFSLLSKVEIDQGTKDISGLDIKADSLAAHAIRFLVSLIHQQVFGIPDSPRIYMISGEFSGGRTLRKTG